MRHRVDHRKLGRTASHRKAMLSNMVTSLFRSERITTTDAKAKEARRLAERLITRAKKGHAAHTAGDKAVALAHWRMAARTVRDTDVLRKLFDQIAPHFAERNGGYTRIIKMGTRLGDNARTVLLELVDTSVTSLPVMRGGSGSSEESATSAKSKAKGKSRAKVKTGSKTGDSKKTSSKTKSKSKASTKSKSRAKTKAKAKAGSK